MAALTRFGVWIILVYILNTVSCQTDVRVYVGETALLPCSYTSTVPTSVAVYWRDKDDSIVLDIEDSTPKLGTQSQKFKNRVASFRELYKDGNFSISLQDVQQADAGVYECHIRIADGSEQRIRLTVAGKKVEVAATVTLPGPAGGAATVTLPGPAGGAATVTLPGPAGGAAAVTPASVQLLLFAALSSQSVV